LGEHNLDLHRGHLLLQRETGAHTDNRSPDYDTPNERFGYPFGLIVYYSWNFLATIILVNVLIALFGSAYSDVTENAVDEYLAFFAHKTVDLSGSPI
jgi:hypothetical protein